VLAVGQLSVIALEGLKLRSTVIQQENVAAKVVNQFVVTRASIAAEHGEEESCLPVRGGFPRRCWTKVREYRG